MLPAQQRLGADDAAARQVELRLVVDDELVLVERRAQAILERDAPLDRGVHVLGVEVEAVAAALLGVVHRGVGALEQRLGVLRVAREGGDADAAADRGALLAELQRLAERGDELARDGGGVELVAEVGEQHGELVAAEPRGGVGLAQARGDAPRDAAQQAVADRVAERVVDRLEAVEVDEEHRELLAAAPRRGDRLGEPVVEERAVGEAR